MKATKEHIGKRAVFRALCTWNEGRKATRIIKEVREDGSIYVKYGGYTKFHINVHEIKDIY